MPRKRQGDFGSGKLFAEPQPDFLEKSAEEVARETASKTVECLGRTFDSEALRREHFLENLRNKLDDPEFRKIPGFPVASNEDILRLSDPPYFTVCPNPFLNEFAGEAPTKSREYHREPFAVDVRVGRTNQLYKAHGYVTKVPHLAIVPSILHYTKPGDLVLDPFCGSGMTGVAAQWCGTAPASFRREVELDCEQAGHSKPEWGPRKVVLNDLGPAATFIAANYNTPFDLAAFSNAARALLADLRREIGWMYSTKHADGTQSEIEYTVWSEVFGCPECNGEVIFTEQALDKETGRVRREFSCPGCSARLKKSDLERRYETVYDDAIAEPIKQPQRRPVLIVYRKGKERFNKEPDDSDLDTLERAKALPFNSEVPTGLLPYMHRTHERARMDLDGVTHVHHFFSVSQARALGLLWRLADSVDEVRLRNMILFFVEQAIWGMSLMARYVPTHYSQVNQYLDGVYYIPSQGVDVSPWYILEGKLNRLRKAFSPMPSIRGGAVVTTGDAAAIPIEDDTVDYIFTDPPFGENKYYSDLNFLVESFHGVQTNSGPEAIIDKAKQKRLADYQELMKSCFLECYRVLKPGHWMTVVFSSSSNAVWRAIQEGIGRSGFVVADVRTLDKEQGSFNQVAGFTVKQDLVISAYKPTTNLESRFKLGDAEEQGAWQFVAEHLLNLPVFAAQRGQAEIVAERTAQLLHDRMVAFHVQRGIGVPMSAPVFLAGLEERYPERDGMYFLPEQVAEYDRKRAGANEPKQLSLFVTDEASAIRWVRQALQRRPQNFQDLQPQFMKELQAWAKHEETVELKRILSENFLCYEGAGPVPAQIHGYLSTNFKDCRNLEKTDPVLVQKARDRWYVADPAKQGDLEQIRSKRLLAEFEEYLTSKERQLKQFRTEAIRAGFSAAWNAKNLEAIITVAEKIPESVLHEDPDLVMYYDNASTLLGRD